MRIGCVLLTATAALGLAGVSGRPARADDNRDGYRRYPGSQPRDRYERGSRDDSSASGRSDFDDEGYAVEPYWAYPPEYYIFSRHPSRYYYTFPDRYYSRRPRDQWRWYDRGRADREDNYGYRGPYGPYPEYRWDDQDHDYRDYRDDRDRDYRDYRDYRDDRDRMYRQRDGYRQRDHYRGERDRRYWDRDEQWQRDRDGDRDRGSDRAYRHRRDRDSDDREYRGDDRYERRRKGW